MKKDTFILPVSRPSFVSVGHYFLTKPRFIISQDLVIPLDWEIKCFKKLPALSLRIVRVTYGKGKGGYAADLSKNFALPDEMEFPETQALPKKMNAFIRTRCVLKLINFEETPTGIFRLLIEMKFWEETHTISQNFILTKG